jgi:hypothetical protein
MSARRRQPPAQLGAQTGGRSPHVLVRQRRRRGERHAVRVTARSATAPVASRLVTPSGESGCGAAPGRTPSWRAWPPVCWSARQPRRGPFIRERQCDGVTRHEDPRVGSVGMSTVRTLGRPMSAPCSTVTTEGRGVAKGASSSHPRLGPRAGDSGGRAEPTGHRGPATRRMPSETPSRSATMASGWLGPPSLAGTSGLDHHFDHHWGPFGAVRLRSPSFRMLLDLRRRTQADARAPAADGWGSGAAHGRAGRLGCSAD